MKKIFAFIFIALCALNVDAQIWSSNSSMTVSTVEEKVHKPVKKGYNRLTLSYSSMKYKWDGEKSDAMKGFDMGYDHGWSVSNKLPIYIEGGFHFQGNFLSTEDEEYDDEYLGLHFRVYVPISVTYRYSFGKNAFVAPYFGLNVQGTPYDVDLWDYKDSNDDEKPKWVQLGCQMGVNLGFKHLNLQVGYKTDFMKVIPETKTGAFYAGLGVNF